MATPIPENNAAFSLPELVAATGGRVAVSAQQRFGRVVTDTRGRLDDGVFVALVGERFDAHQFLDQAVERGARCLVVQACAAAFALCERLSSDNPQQVSVLVVDDCLQALGELALAHRLRHAVRIVAVVGSAGKTTTRSVISALMNYAAPELVLSTRGNLNNRIGVPMTLLGLTAAHKYAVLELGTNCPGEIAALGHLVQPDVALLTLIDLEHTEGLGDLDGVEREESAVFEFLRPGGVAIGYGEDPRVLRSLLASGASAVRSYGEDIERDLRIALRRFVPPAGAQLSLERKAGAELSFATSLIGKAGALAVAGGILAAEALLGRELTADECGAALVQVGEAGRHTIVELGQGSLVVDDTYNSNPASVRLSIGTGRELAAASGGRLFLVLGEMLELGSLSVSSHVEMGEAAAQAGAAGIFFVQGDARLALEPARKVVENVKFFEDAQPVAEELAPLLEPGDVVVVKASRGVRAERVVQGLARSFQSHPPR